MPRLNGCHIANDSDNEGEVDADDCARQGSHLRITDLQFWQGRWEGMCSKWRLGYVLQVP